jgi:hypothetical protein
MYLRAFRNETLLGIVRLVDAPVLHANGLLSRRVEVEMGDPDGWAHHDARYELENGQKQRLIVLPQPDRFLVYDANSTRAILTVHYDGRARFAWPWPPDGGSALR